jgi:ABC-type multidrug transport system ATPase subunit
MSEIERICQKVIFINKGKIREEGTPEDLVKKFRLEFQNFGKRKRLFEIVYVISSDELSKNRKKWKFVTKRI